MTQTRSVPNPVQLRSYLWWSVAPLVTLAALVVVPVAILVATGVMDSSGVLAVVALVAACGLVDWLVAPSVVRWAIRASEIPHDGTRYLTSEPVGAIVARRCRDAGLPLVALAIVDDGTPNAFAFGRSRLGAHVYVTRGLLERLDDAELDAVVAHELGHIRNHDFVIMTMAMMVPLALYVVGISLLESDDSDDDDEGGGFILGLGVLVLWLVAEYVVLWLSRSRELAADHWSCRCTGNGDALVSALVKVGYGMSVQAAADGAAGLREQTRRDHAAERVNALGIFDQGAASAMANGFFGGLDINRAVAAIRWEGRNPWARVLEKTSTHPLVGRRIAALQASGLPGRPTWLGLDAARLESHGAAAESRLLRRAFAADVAVLVLPWVAFGTAVWLLLTGPATWTVGLLLAGAGVLFVAAQCRRYPFPARGIDEVTMLLHRMDASPVRGIAVEARGRIIGRDTPGLVVGADLVLQDASGIVALDYRQPIPFANALFGFRKAEELIGHDVVVRGWYRRTPDPVIELRDLRTADGRCVRPRLWLARFVAAGAIVAAGLAVTSAQLATTGGA